jgi:hypothetical protein
MSENVEQIDDSEESQPQTSSISAFEFTELPSRSEMRRDENYTLEKEKNERRYANSNRK